MKTFLVVLLIKYFLANIVYSQTCSDEPLCECKYIESVGVDGVNCSSRGLSNIPIGIPVDLYS